jgi:hypothetical protein
VAHTADPVQVRDLSAAAPVPAVSCEAPRATAPALALLERAAVADRPGQIARLQALAGNRAVTVALRPSECSGPCECGSANRAEPALPRTATIARVMQPETVQRKKENEKPLGDIQYYPMSFLLPALEKLEPVARTDREAGGFVGGPRLVVAMNAVAMKGNWKTFAAANSNELGSLPIDQIGDIMRYVGAPTDVKTFERSEFEGRFDAFVDPGSGLISLIFKARVIPVEENPPTPDEVKQFQSEFKSIVESTWSNKGTVKPACPGLKTPSFKTKVTVLFVDGGEHLPITLYNPTVRTGAIETDSNTGKRTGRMSADAGQVRPTEQYEGQPRGADGKITPLKSNQATAAHEFGHAIGVDHVHCKGGGACYGTDQQEWDDVMGGGMKVQVIKDAAGKVLHDDFKPFERIGERWGKDVFPGGAAKCNTWTAG